MLNIYRGSNFGNNLNNFGKEGKTSVDEVFRVGCGWSGKFTDTV